MRRTSFVLRAYMVLCAAILITVAYSQRVVAEDHAPKGQFIYKTIGERPLTVDVFYPADWSSNDERPAIVFFSGGAWRTGGTAQFLPQSRYFAKRGMVTVRAEYRDSTKDKVKPDTCLKDAVSAMRWVRKNAKQLGIDPERIVSSGGSAGGYLAAAVSTIDDFHSDSDDVSVSPKPSAMVLFNPVLDFVTLDRAAEFGIVGDLAQRISPLRHVTSELPPTLILIGSEDRFLEQNRQFVRKGEALGARVELEVAPGQPHAYFNRSPWLEKTVASADRFLVSLGYLRDEPRVELPSSTSSPHEDAETVRVLTVGNSFARNACRYLKQIAESGNVRIVVGTANIGGCTLEKHAMLAAQSAEDDSVKPYRDDRDESGKKLSLQAYLEADAWDYVTVQQMSALSYRSDSFHPHFEQLAATIMRHAPNAKILVHETWAYRPDSPLLKRDNLTQQEMYERLRKAYAAAADQLNTRVIPVGAAFQRARSAERREVLVRDPEFDFENPVYPNRPRQTNSLVTGWYWREINGEQQLRLDYKHGNTKGCFLAGLVWYEALTGNDARETTFVPEGINDEDAVFFRQIAHTASTRKPTTITP